MIIFIRSINLIDNFFLLAGSAQIHEREQKTALLYDYSFEKIGGGQKVTATIAHILKDHCKVTLIQTCLSNKYMTKAKVKKYYGLDLSGVVFNVAKNISEVSLQSRKYDIFINAEPGPWINPQARLNLMWAHDPILRPQRENFIDRYDYIITISEWSKNLIKKIWNKDSYVMYAGLKAEGLFVPWKERKNQILLVARFDKDRPQGHWEAIEVFKELKMPSKLVFVGNVWNKGYLRDLQVKTKHYNARFFLNPTFKEMNELYSYSKVLWNIRGYGQNDFGEGNPLQESFGLVTIEAMQYGCIPLVYNYAGHRDAVKNPELRFNTLEELREKTEKILAEDYEALSIQICNASKEFCYEAFGKRLIDFLHFVEITKNH